jgi:drug/metabolite transporter (DMT)-like permease
VGATLLAAILPGIRGRPTLYTLMGGALVLGGILLAERKRPQA